MPMFGVYYIPEASHPLYQTASQIMGYDVREGTLLPEVNPVRSRFSGFDSAWVLAAQEFGFHATIGHVMTFDPARLPLIERRIEETLNLFDPEKPFVLTPTAEHIHMDGKNLTLYYHANQPFMMFHAMIVAHLHPLGLSTPFSEEYAAGQHQHLTPTQYYRTKMYHQFHILDDWLPHLRIVGHHNGENLSELREELREILPVPEPLTVGSICLVLKEDGSQHFKLYREYMRADYPQPLHDTN